MSTVTIERFREIYRAAQVENNEDYFIQCLIERMAGEIVYIPNNAQARIGLKTKRIKQEFNGKNHTELARKYDVSVQWIYKLIKDARNEKSDI